MRNVLLHSMKRVLLVHESHFNYFYDYTFLHMRYEIVNSEPKARKKHFELIFYLHYPQHVILTILFVLQT